MKQGAQSDPSPTVLVSLDHRGEYPERVTLDGVLDKGGRVRYIGDATFSHSDGFYRCLAAVDNCLCVVEVKLTLGAPTVAKHGRGYLCTTEGQTMGEQGKCDFCGQRARVSIGEHMGGCGYSAICEFCAEAATCEFLEDRQDHDEGSDDG